MTETFSCKFLTNQNKTMHWIVCERTTIFLRRNLWFSSCNSVCTRRSLQFLCFVERSRNRNNILQKTFVTKTLSITNDSGYSLAFFLTHYKPYNSLRCDADQIRNWKSSLLNLKAAETKVEFICITCLNSLHNIHKQWNISFW